MTRALIVEPDAAEELERGILWYEHERPGTGAELADEAETVMKELATSPVKGLTTRNPPRPAGATQLSSELPVRDLYVMMRSTSSPSRI